jgi:hypothetical protein
MRKEVGVRTGGVSCVVEWAQEGGEYAGVRRGKWIVGLRSLRFAHRWTFWQ